LQCCRSGSESGSGQIGIILQDSDPDRHKGLVDLDTDLDQQSLDADPDRQALDGDPDPAI
jgi:hypothetical protein